MLRFYDLFIGFKGGEICFWLMVMRFFFNKITLKLKLNCETDGSCAINFDCTNCMHNNCLYIWYRSFLKDFLEQVLNFYQIIGKLRVQKRDGILNCQKLLAIFI